MNTSRLHRARRYCALSVCLSAFLASGRAQQVTQAPTPAQLAKYDVNKNGVLDPNELAAMQADETKATKAAVAQATGEEQNKDVVELSPFEVNASNDKGYLAGSTMSGTRLNSKLEDLAASITVVTKQQLLDTAAVDINDIFLYEANTEGTGQFTDPTNDGRGIYDNVSGNPQTANRIRGLGAANIAIGGFSGNSSLPIDTYNVDAVEISRGPNTNIFGMGDASGTVNLVPSKANVTREITNITTQGDNWGGFRTTLDLNRPVFRGERSLALRFQSAYEEKGFVRKPSADRTNRWQISLTAKPFKKTTINASYESYHNFNSRPNSEPPRDTIAYWRAHGRPTWDPYTWTAKVNGVAVGTFTAGADGTLPAGLQSPGTSNARIQAIVDSGQYVFLQRGVNVNPLTAGANGGVAGPNVGQSANQRVVFSGTDIGRGGGGIFGGVATPH
jgi:outer membrane receptor protein involved in Fe transport